MELSRLRSIARLCEAQALTDCATAAANTEYFVFKKYFCFKIRFIPNSDTRILDKNNLLVNSFKKITNITDDCCTFRKTMQHVSVNCRHYL